MYRTALMRAYGLAAHLALPRLARARMARLNAAGVTEARAREVLGHATAARPEGRLLWVHAASVGESLSVLPILHALPEGVRVLMTTATPTAADILAQRLPDGALHQFAPLDAPVPARRFLDHWRPDASMFVESELWPTLLAASTMPAALIGARLSEKSLRRWAKVPRTAQAVLGRFALILAQNDDVAQALRGLGAAAVETGGNLKALSGALPVDAGLLTQARDTLEGRPVWMAASTHPGEDRPILEAHKAALAQHPDLCLILAPRHPERRPEVEALCTALGLTVTTRGRGGWPDRQVWLVDTLGELGSLYPLSPLVLLGGSLQPIGGHNPFEVAHAGAAILTGPHTENFSETYAALEGAGAVQRTTAQTLQSDLSHLLADPQHIADLQARAARFAAAQTGEASALAQRLTQVLGL
ncbi:MAG: 3-deoxy-D-manno-octulosonic acid transferase [Pseudomonadota bacterium]